MIIFLIKLNVLFILNITIKMNYDKLKSVIRTYVGDVVDSEEFENLFTVCNSITGTHLHKCVLLTNKYPSLNDYLENFLKHYSGINKVNNVGFSALHLAATNSNYLSTEKTVEILISAGADVNLEDVNFQTALHFCACYSNTTSSERTVQILIDAGTYVNTRNRFNYTAISFAVSHLGSTSTEETVKILINADADIFNLNDMFGCPVVDYLSEELKEKFQIDVSTQTIGIKTGKLTKCARNLVNC